VTAVLLFLGLALAFEPDVLDATIERTPGIVAVVVEHEGSVVYRRQVEPGHTRGRKRDAIPGLHDIRSAGKSITALAVGAAIADGALASVEEPVWPLLGAGGGDHDDITVRDLLTMSSALDCNDWEGRRSPGFEERMYRRRSWRDFVLSLPLDPAYERDADGRGRFAYCTAGVFLLGQVVQEVTGEPFDAYVQRRLFDPIGVGPVVWRRSRSGEVQSGGQLEIGAEDLARIGRLVLERGRHGDAQVLPASWTKEMLRPWRQLGPHAYYGYLFWAGLVRSPRGTEPGWSMMGNGGNLVVLLDELDTVVVVQAANYNDGGASEASLRVVSAALDGLVPGAKDR